MGRILYAAITPHPPIMIPEIGGNRIGAIQQTIDAAWLVAQKIADAQPTVIVLSSPHAPCFRDTFHIAGDAVLSGDFTAFGHPEIALSFACDQSLSDRIEAIARSEGLSAAVRKTSEVQTRSRGQQLDHGALVPLYFIQKALPNVRLVLLSTPFAATSDLFRFGQCIARAVRASDENVVYVASGDLSHGLTPDAPAGLRATGAGYDQSLIDMIRKTDTDRLLAITDRAMDDAAECGTRSILMMFGALSELEIKPTIHAYEGPFGVGYLTASVAVVESAPVRLAREAINAWVSRKEIASVPAEFPVEWTKRKAGAFVSIKKHGGLRGCIGTITASQSNLVDEIIRNARLACSEDPRFPPVSKEELSDLEINVDILGDAESIHSVEELDVQRYGVIVRAGWRCGLLLPALEGVDTPQQQLKIALQKGGIQAQEPYDLERFEVIRYY